MSTNKWSQGGYVVLVFYCQLRDEGSKSLLPSKLPDLLAVQPWEVTLCTIVISELDHVKSKYITDSKLQKVAGSDCSRKAAVILIN